MILSGSRLLSALLLVLLLSTWAVAGTHGELVERYIALSGMGELLKSIPQEMDALASQRSLTSRHPEVEKRVYRLVRESFDVRKARKELFSYLLRATDKGFVEQIVRWLETPLAKKITREELDASGADHQGELLRYLADLESNPPSGQRIALVQGVERVTHLSELSTDIVVEVTRGLMESVNLALPEEQREPLDDALEEMEGMRPVIQEGFRQQMVLTSFYAYRNIGDGELADYTRFYESDLGQREIRITGAALGHVLKQWFGELGKKLAAEAAESRHTRGTTHDPTPEEGAAF